MFQESLARTISELTALVRTGLDNLPATEKLQPIAARLDELVAEHPDLARAAELARKALDTEADEQPLPVLALMGELASLSPQRIDAAAPVGELTPFSTEAKWATPMPIRDLYQLMPETRRFAKRTKAAEQTAIVERLAREDAIADLRTVGQMVAFLGEKTDAALALAVEKKALPAYGIAVLPDLFPSVAPGNRAFNIAYHIDPDATLAKLSSDQKPGKKADRGSRLTEAISKMVDRAYEEEVKLAVDALPLLRQGLKVSGDPVSRQRIARLIADFGPAAIEAVPDLIDAFEKGGLTRDYRLIQPMVSLGRDAEEVCDCLIRAMTDRDANVRLCAAFNLGAMGKSALKSIGELETVAENDTEPRVRDEALKSSRRLDLLRQAMAVHNIEDDEEAEDEVAEVADSHVEKAETTEAEVIEAVEQL